MNEDAVALQCCEKLSQHMKRIFKETEEKKSEHKEWQSKKEATRLMANKLRFSPFESNVRIRESQLNARAYRVAIRGIEAVGQQCRENWRRDSHNKQLLKEIDLERSKLIRLETELDLFKQREDKRALADRENRVPEHIKDFANKFSKLKTCLNKLELMTSRYETSLNFISDISQAKLLVAELRAKFQERQNQEATFDEQLRAYTTTLQTKIHIQHSGKIDSKKQNTLENDKDVDEEVLRERLLNEHETNEQLESLLIYARNWLHQEEHFKNDVKMYQETG